MIPQPGPQTTPCWYSIHQQTFLATFAVSGSLGGVLRLQSLRLTLHAFWSAFGFN